MREVFQRTAFRPGLPTPLNSSSTSLKSYFPETTGLGVRYAETKGFSEAPQGRIGSDESEAGKMGRNSGVLVKQLKFRKRWKHTIGRE